MSRGQDEGTNNTRMRVVNETAGGLGKSESINWHSIGCGRRFVLVKSVYHNVFELKNCELHQHLGPLPG